MSLKEELLQYGHTHTLHLSETELHQKIESTLTRTFLWMWSALLIAFGVAYTTAIGILPLPYSSTLFWVSWLAGFGIIIAMSRKRRSISYQNLGIMLILFALLEGYGLTGVFWMYNMGDIYNVFLLTAGMFFALAFAGYALKIDVASVWGVLTVALVVLILGSLINAFWWNETFNIWLSVIGVIVFSAFIVYDISALKQMAAVADQRIEILIALNLFLSFVNLFLFLLRLFGNSRD